MRIAVIPGEGIGPEIIDATIKVLDSLELPLDFIPVKVGWERFQKEGVSHTEDDIELLKSCDAILKGPLYTPTVREKGGFKSMTVTLRQALELYANVRPGRSLPISLHKGVDMVIVRENTECLYSGIEQRTEDGAIAIRKITRRGSMRIARFAFEYALRYGRKRVTCVHKANILSETCGLFKECFEEVAKSYPTILADDMLVDTCAYRLLKSPQDFDVIVTTNLFGDILSNEVLGIVGSLGLGGAANVGDEHAMFEPVHGVAADRAGKNTANPSSSFMAASYMLEYLGFKNEADVIMQAIEDALKEGKHLTSDLGGKATTTEFTEEIIRRIKDRETSI